MLQSGPADFTEAEDLRDFELGTPAPATGFLDNFRATRSEMFIAGNSTSGHLKDREAYVGVVEALNEGRDPRDRFINPFDLSETGSYGFDRPGLPRQPWGTRAAMLQRIHAEIRARRQRDPSYLRGIPDTAEEYLAQVRARDAARLAEIRGVQDRATTTGTIGSFLGGVAGAFQDPVTLVTLPIGGAGRTVGMRILSEGLVGAGAEALIQPGVASNYERVGEDYGLGDAARSILFAGAAGAALRGGFELAAPPAKWVLGRGYDKAIEALFYSVPESVQRRWADAGTIDDRAIVEAFRRAVPDDQVTPDERAAIHAVERDAEIREASPYEPTLEGEATNADRLSEAMRRILDDTAPSARAEAMVGTAKPAGPLPTRGVSRGTSSVTNAQVKSKIGPAEASHDRAENPRSTADGRYQFTDGTWVRMWRRRYGNDGRSRAEILARKFDADHQEALMDELINFNRAELRRRGYPDNLGNLYLMHWAGEGGGIALLRAAPDTPAIRILGADAANRNPGLIRGKTAAEVVEWAHRRVGDSVPAGGYVGEPPLRREAFDADGPDRHFAPFGTQHADLAEDWNAAVARLRADQGGEVPGALWHPELGEVGLVWGRSGRAGYGLADIIDRRADLDIEGLRERVMGMDVASRSRNRVRLESEDGTEAVRLEWDRRGKQWILAEHEQRPARAAARAAPREAGEAEGPVIEVKPKKPRRRYGPVHVMQAISDAGGIIDNEGHDLVRGRNIPKFMLGAGVIIRPEGHPRGKSVDAIGEYLWERGYFGPVAVTERPTEADVLELIERAVREKIYRVEDQAGIDAKAAQRAGEAEEAAALDELASTAEDWGIELDPETLDDALHRVAAGERIDEALSSAIDAAAWRDADRLEGETGDEIYAMDDAGRPWDDDINYEQGAASGADPEAPDWFGGSSGFTGSESAGGGFGAEPSRAPAGDGPGQAELAALGRFDDPDGEGARAQADSLEHDLRMDAALDRGAEADPAVAERDRQKAGLGAASPLRGKAEQDGTMGLGLFDAADEPRFQLVEGTDAKDLGGIFDEIDADLRAAAELRGCMKPRGRVE